MQTSYNFFNFDFYLTYNRKKNVRAYLYINKKIDVNNWSMSFFSANVCIMRLNVMINDVHQIVNIHNVYNSSFKSYTFEKQLFNVIIARQLLKTHSNEKHVLLKNFNLHHSMWNDFFRFIQHIATNQFLDVVRDTFLHFTLSKNIVTWKTRKIFNIIDLIFMTKNFKNELLHCHNRQKMN